MAEITRRRAGELLRGTCLVLRDEGEPLPANVVLERLEQIVPPTPFELSAYPNRPQERRYGRIARFLSIRAVKAGWLVKDKGIWSLTDAGLMALETYDDPERSTPRHGASTGSGKRISFPRSRSS